ncbi:MAG TPA: endonuclease III [Candidatus Binatus sp.]|nr:endonuclease III [Candidatus Binatus sp.]
MAARRAPIDSRSISRVLQVLRREALGWNAPIVSFIAVQHRDPFRTLISCILSLRTQDATTAAASMRLFEQAYTPETILALSPKKLERLIFPVGFYRTKVRVIRGICRDLIDKFNGRVPDEIDQLLTLKGVGRKTANLVVTEAYGKPGICVDTHVHRISNRWGLVRTKTPEKTEMALRAVLPPRHWLEYNGILVAFGQTICHPTSPWCSRCKIEAMCPKLGVLRSR